MIDLLRNCPAPVGIVELDEQHMELHRLLWWLLKALETDPNDAVPGERFICFADQTADHYRTEEEFLQTMGYPDLVAHRQDHQKILKRFKESMALWNSPGAPQLANIVQELAELTQRHLKIGDRAFTDWIEEQEGKSFSNPD